MSDDDEIRRERDDEEVEAVLVSHRDLSAEALRGVIEAFVLREGTDYGEVDVPFERKTAQVLAQLECGEARIVWDPRTQSVDIVPVSARERRG